jgi:hypothetical protein
MQCPAAMEPAAAGEEDIFLLKASPLPHHAGKAAPMDFPIHTEGLAEQPPPRQCPVILLAMQYPFAVESVAARAEDILLLKASPLPHHAGQAAPVDVPIHTEGLAGQPPLRQCPVISNFRLPGSNWLPHNSTTSTDTVCHPETIPLPQQTSARTVSAPSEDGSRSMPLNDPNTSLSIHSINSSKISNWSFEETLISLEPAMPAETRLPHCDRTTESMSVRAGTDSMVSSGQSAVSSWHDGGPPPWHPVHRAFLLSESANSGSS